MDEHKRSVSVILKNPHEPEFDSRKHAKPSPGSANLFQFQVSFSLMPRD